MLVSFFCTVGGCAGSKGDCDGNVCGCDGTGEAVVWVSCNTDINVWCWHVVSAPQVAVLVVRVVVMGARLTTLYCQLHHHPSSPLPCPLPSLHKL